MKIVRTLWGDSEYIKNEIPRTPLFGSAEIVFVWGTENRRFLDELGYRTVLVDSEITDSEYSTHLLHFAHKLKAIKIAENIFSEFLFLDWDVTIAKDIDDNFYSAIRSGNNIQCPLYGYHANYREDVEIFHRNDNTYTENLDDFIIKHIENLEKYHWKLGSLKVLPCFCFFYVRDVKVGGKLLEIMKNNNIVACIEEFAFYVYSECSLDDYINKYEPSVIRGKERDKNLPGMTVAISEINSYIGTKIEKDIYLLHDLI